MKEREAEWFMSFEERQIRSGEGIEERAEVCSLLIT